MVDFQVLKDMKVFDQKKIPIWKKSTSGKVFDYYNQIVYNVLNQNLRPNCP